jgi:hypothetical protein
MGTIILPKVTGNDWDICWKCRNHNPKHCKGGLSRVMIETYGCFYPLTEEQIEEKRREKKEVEEWAKKNGY